MADPFTDLPVPQRSARRVYAYRLNLPDLAGRIKVGETARTVQGRVEEQVRTVGLSDVVEVLLDEPAITKDGRPFRDTHVHEQLEQDPDVRRLTQVGGVEWFECSTKSVLSAFNRVVEGRPFDRNRDKRFPPRDEQERAVAEAGQYFDMDHPDGQPPRFLWNAKMRFGKTFAAYLLAKRMHAKRVLVVTYKPAVETSWKDDLEAHVDFDGWVFFSRDSDLDPSSVAPDTPLVCFSSLQDLRGLTEDGAIKDHNIWIHQTEWDLVVVDEYHYGAWNEATKELLAGEDAGGASDYAMEVGEDEDPDGLTDRVERLAVRGAAFLCLSGTPFRALAGQEFGPEQIFNWTYTDEQREKARFPIDHPDERNPYLALPTMNLLAYRLPDRLRVVASSKGLDEFDLNEFFRASGRGRSASFVHKDHVQSWLEWLCGQDEEAVVEVMASGGSKPFPYSDTAKVLPYMNHSVWFLPSVAAVFAMRNLLEEPQNHLRWSQYKVLPVAGTGAGVGVDALGPVQEAIGNGIDTKTITLTCGKLLTGVTVPQWSAILMLNNVQAPETYFQAAFRVQSPWSVRNPDGNDPHEEQVLKPACLTIDFAPNRALRLFADYGMRLGAGPNADKDLRELSRFLPVLTFDGTQMRSVDVEQILDTAFQSTSIDARRMDSKRFIRPDMKRLELLSEGVLLALDGIRRSPSEERSENGEDVVVNTNPELRDVGDHSDGEDERREPCYEDEEMAESELEERLRFLVMRLNAFMYLSEPVEKNLHDVLTTEENSLFREVMELSSEHMTELVDAGLFNEQAMRVAIHQFRRADAASLSYTGVDAREGLDAE